MTGGPRAAPRPQPAELPTPNSPLWWFIVLLLQVAVAFAPLLPLAPLRAALVLAFLLWAPGAALVGLVPSLDPLARAVLSNVCSVAILLLGSAMMVQTRAWHPMLLILVEQIFVLLTASYALFVRLRPSCRAGWRARA